MNKNIELSVALENVVKELSDNRKWTWVDMCSRNSAADQVLKLMARNGIIEHRKHPMGGDVWRINGHLYGRTDGVTQAKFPRLEQEPVYKDAFEELREQNK